MAKIFKNIGIVVPTRNRPKNVVNFLAAIETSTAFPAVCIIVDSSDFTYELPECSFPVRFETPGIKGQVKQRNYGIKKLKEFGEMEYAFLLDDDILLEPNAIQGAMDSIGKYVNKCSEFVGFALNITNLPNSRHLFRRLLFYPAKPGKVTKSTYNSSLASLAKDIECDWVLGGAGIWDLDFIINNPSDYPFVGKAYSEDLYYCSMIRKKAKFAAIYEAKCAHVDLYEIRREKNTVHSGYVEGLNDTRIRLSIAKRFEYYSIFRTMMHILWVSILGSVYGLFTFDSTALMVGVGRANGIFKSLSEGYGEKICQ